ncbi:major facilitator superfamily domain-containing protein [Cytidiella melzeri]|nr:major facilitator superfamily domain-containing protein [Cytidiella melzeri]
MIPAYRDSEASYRPTDPIMTSNIDGLYTPSASRIRPHLSESLQHGSRSLSPTQALETAPLLGRLGTKKPFYRPRPLWLVPFGIVASIVRGMTLAPRVQVFTQLSCNELYGHDVYDHTSHSGINTTTLYTSPHSSHTLLYSTLDPFGPHYGRQSLDPVFSSSDNIFPSDFSSIVPREEDGVDPRLVVTNRCLSDPRVQSGAARLQTTVTTTMGALSALTTGCWGQFGEQYGRTRVLAAATLGLFLTDLTFILVSTPHSVFATHGRILLIVSPIIEGLLGGWSTLHGATFAYISDCTSDGSRAKVFSRFTGVFYLGFSLGPALGAYLIRHPLFSFPSTSSGQLNGQPSVTSVFYVAAMASFVNLLLVLFIFPESLEKKKAKEGLQRAVVPRVTNGGGDPVVLKKQSFIARFFSLALLAPKKVAKADGGYSTDWSLTVLATTFFLYLLAMGVFQIKYLYAEHVYQWSSEQLSYYISFVGGVRALQLLVIMPYIITTFKPKVNLKQPQSASSSAAVHHDGLSKQPLVPHAKNTKPTLAQLMNEMKFDVLLLRCSLFLDVLSHTLVSLCPPDAGQALFVGFTALSSLGSGFHPGVNSVALCILQMRARTSGQNSSGGDDGGVGRLFGALAALQAVGQMILGPLIFGMIYSSTVATFPKAIFVTAAGTLLVALVLIFFLRPDASLRVKRRVRRDDDSERGRSRISKDLGRKSSPPINEPSGSGSGSGSL